MGNCKYCNKKAGFLKNVHPECEEKKQRELEHFKQCVSKIKELPLSYKKDEPFENILEKSKVIANECSMSDDFRIETLVEGINDLVDKFLDDGVISIEEQNIMGSIVTSIDYDFSEINEKVQKGIVLRNLTEGKIQECILDGCPINFEKNEILVYGFGGVILYEMTEQRHYEGGSAGFSFRVAKGLYYRTSAFKGYPVISNELKPKGAGMFFITNKNLYFYSEARTEKIPLKKIIATTNYNDGIGIQREGKTAKPMVFKMAVHPEDGWFVCNVISNILEIKDDYTLIENVKPSIAKSESESAADKEFFDELRELITKKAEHYYKSDSDRIKYIEGYLKMARDYKLESRYLILEQAREID